MAASRLGFIEVILMFLLNLPYGLPPGEEDAKLSQIALKDCYAHLVWNGTVAADPQSSNATERMLADPKVKAFLDSLEQELLNRSSGITGSAPNQVRPTLEKAVRWIVSRRDYPTSITVQSINFQGNFPFQISIVTKVDKDLEATRALEEEVIKLFATEAPNQSFAITDRQLDGIKIRSFAPDGEEFQVEWCIKDDYLVITFGNNMMEMQLGTWKNTESPSWLDLAKKRVPVERRGHLLYLDAEKFLGDVLAMGPPPQFLQFLATFGIDDLKQVVTTYGLDGETALSRIVFHHKGTIPDTLKPFVDKRVDLSSVPADANIMFAGAVDMPQLLDFAIRGSDAFEQGWGQQLNDALAQAAPLIGGHPRECIFEALGPNMVLYSSESEHPGPIPGATLAIDVNDVEAFTSVYEALQAMAGPAVAEAGGLDTLKVGDHVIYTMANLGPGVPVQPSWCLTDSKLLLATQERSLSAYLNRDDEFKPKPAKQLLDATTDNTHLSMVGFIDVRKYTPLLEGLIPMALQQIPSPTGSLPEFMASMPTPTDVQQYMRPSIITLSHDDDSVELVVKESVPVMQTLPNLATALLAPRSERTMARPVRARAKRAQAANFQKQMAIAILNYHDANGNFPPAYLKTKDGKPGLSWRVAILPYIEGGAELHKEFRLDEPWDSDHNKKLIEKMPALFRSPNSKLEEPKSNFVTIRHKQSAFPGTDRVRMRDITDGTSNTLFSVEVDDERAVPWTKPVDFELKKGDKPLEGLGAEGSISISVGFVDGSIQQIPKTISYEDFLGIATRNGAEPIDRDVLVVP